MTIHKLDKKTIQYANNLSRNMQNTVCWSAYQQKKREIERKL
jgi:hypothetical protein